LNYIILSVFIGFDSSTSRLGVVVKGDLNILSSFHVSNRLLRIKL